MPAEPAGTGEPSDRPELTFSDPTLDRAAHLRAGDYAVRAWREAGSAALAVGPGQSVALATPASLRRLVTAELPADAEPILLGREDGAALFATDAEAHPLEVPLEFTGLRDAARSLNAREAGIAAFAVAMIGWHRTHRFCGRCAARTRAEQAGHVRVCPQCGMNWFPRTDPAVTMLVESGERAVLTRRVRAATATTWSALAGFVEPGETPESAVAREALEEVGVVVERVRYVVSQPWPFPQALMLGYRAYADPRAPEVRVTDPEELVEARWFTRAELRSTLAAGATLPPPYTIGHFLITSWLERDAGRGARER